jgi:hypothetical protein
MNHIYNPYYLCCRLPIIAIVLSLRSEGKSITFNTRTWWGPASFYVRRVPPRHRLGEHKATQWILMFSHPTCHPLPYPSPIIIKYYIIPAPNSPAPYNLRALTIHNRECELLTSFFFFLKSCLFLKTEMDNPWSNFTGNTMQCISIDWYPESSAFMLYAAVNASRSPQKATNWSGIKNGKSSKETRLSKCHPIDKKHL